MAMQTINWVKDGKTGSKRVQSFGYDAMVRSFKANGYTIVEDAPAAAEQTGRAGKGLEVHRIVANVAQCGSSYRARRLGGTLPTTITGEQITCSKCLGH